MKTKKQILKEAEIEWGLRVGPKSNQQEQTRVLLSILSNAIAQTREETIKEVEWLFTEKPKRGRPKKIRPGRLIMTKQMLYNSKAILDILNKLKK